MCGGSRRKSSLARTFQGLSPRVRGKPVGGGEPGATAGSIPACAGEARAAACWRPGAGVYPRVCGGSSRMAYRLHLPRGLSPRVRGKRQETNARESPPRSIPACAGEAGCVDGGRASAGVYPRVCGGSHHTAIGHHPVQGLSPRVRGKRRRERLGGSRIRSIPACAGEAYPAVDKA